MHQNVERVLKSWIYICETQSGYSLYFDNYQLSLFVMFLSENEFKGIHIRYTQHKYTFFTWSSLKVGSVHTFLFDGLCLSYKRFLQQNKYKESINITKTVQIEVLLSL